MKKGRRNDLSTLWTGLSLFLLLTFLLAQRAFCGSVATRFLTQAKPRIDFLRPIWTFCNSGRTDTNKRVLAKSVFPPSLEAISSHYVHQSPRAAPLHHR